LTSEVEVGLSTEAVIVKFLSTSASDMKAVTVLSTLVIVVVAFTVVLLDIVVVEIEPDFWG